MYIKKLNPRVSTTPFRLNYLVILGELQHEGVVFASVMTDSSK